MEEQHNRRLSHHRSCIECDKSELDLGRPFKLCGRCKFIYYCSRECQLSNWQTHKEHCNAKAAFNSGRLEPKAANSVNAAYYRSLVCDCMTPVEKRICTNYADGTCFNDECKNTIRGGSVVYFTQYACRHIGFRTALPVRFCGESCYGRTAEAMGFEKPVRVRVPEGQTVARVVAGHVARGKTVCLTICQTPTDE